MPISATNLPTGPFITATSNNFYAIAVDDKDYTVYVSDAIDYIQRSTVMVYNSHGQFKIAFKAGINSSGFYFE